MDEKFSRQIILDEIGLDGQIKIQNAKILVIGAGGLGIPASLYLSSSGIGRIGICDGDIIEPSNLSRQFLYNKNDVGQKKVSVLISKIKQLNEKIELCPYDFYLNEKNAADIFKNYHLILNCSDNLATRKIINKTCVTLSIPWVDGALSQFSGQISYFLPEQGCYECLFPETKETHKNCKEAGILSPICGVFGSWSAVVTLKLILNLIKENTWIELNTNTNRFLKFQWQKNKSCFICQNKIPTNRSPSQNEKKDLQLSLSQLNEFDPNHIVVIDLGLFSLPIQFKDKINSSLNLFYSHNLEDPEFIQQHPDKNKTYVCVCEVGVKSKIAADILAQEGYKSYWLNTKT